MVLIPDLCTLIYFQVIIISLFKLLKSISLLVVIDFKHIEKGAFVFG